MARPLKWKSHDGEADTGPGRSQATKGHDEFGLYVRVYDGFDPAEDTLKVTLEVAANADGDYARVIRGAPRVEDVFELTTVDFEESDENPGVYAAYVGANSFAVEHVRAFIEEHSGGFSVDTTVLVTGSTQAAYRYSEPDGP